MNTKRFKHPLYGIIFFILVAFLSSNFAVWGTEGITFAVLIAGGTVVAIPLGARQLKRSWVAMLEGKHTRLDYLMAPSGYRRNRQEETEKESARYSIVTPTPNRPLQHGDTIESTIIHNKKLPQAPIWTKYGDPILYMAPDLSIPIDLLIGHSIAGLGIRGSGKTSLAARLIEQIGRFPIPMLIGDYEEDYTSLPQLLDRCVIAGCPEWSAKGQYEGYYWDVNQSNAVQTGEYLLEIGYQVVIELRSYQTKEEAAEIFAGIIRGLFKWADNHPKGRVPCLVFLDEAQHFLPENGSVSNIGKESSSVLLSAFDDLNARGRKRGLTPCLFTQRIAQIKKSAIAGSEVWFFGKQQLPVDLERYEEFVGKDQEGKPLVNRRTMQTLPAGTFYLFEDGEYYPITFWNRDTEHRGTTPTFQDALDRYGNTEVSRENPITTTRLPDTEELDEIELEDDNDLPAKKNTATTTIPIAEKRDTRRKAEDIDLTLATAIWNSGYKSRAKLARALDIAENQASKLMEMMKVDG